MYFNIFSPKYCDLSNLGYNCNTPQPPSYAYLDYPMNNKTSFKKGDIITWSCLSGYYAFGNTRQECLGPNWSNGSFHCRGKV